MAEQIFVNLPVKDLNKTVEFFTKLGFKFKLKFTDDNATCMIVADNIFVMLLVENFGTISRTENLSGPPGPLSNLHGAYQNAHNNTFFRGSPHNLQLGVLTAGYIDVAL